MARSKFFKFWEELENSINEAKFGTQPRPLTDEDFTDWTHAQDNMRPTFRNKEEVIAELKRINRYKYWEFEQKVKWVRRKMKKLGLNPEDVRWLM